MRKPGGYAFITSPVPSVIQFDGRREYAPAGVFETDTTSCGHCGRITHVKPYVDAADVGALCKKCMKVVCRQCVNRGRSTGVVSCDPVEAKLERSERAG